MARGVNTSTRGVNTSTRGVNKGRDRGASGQKPKGAGYVDYLKSLKGRNKSAPLTPKQWKQQQGKL